LVIVCTVIGGAPVRAGDEPGTRPIAVWPVGPIEVIAAFDQPVARSSADALVGQSIPYFDGRASAAGRRSSSRLLGQLRIVAIRVIDDNRTLVMATDPHPRAACYVLPLPARNQAPRPGEKANPTAAYDLSGAEVTWSEEGADLARPRWSGWWPRLDAAVARQLTRGSRPHDELFDLLRKRGRLVVSTLIRLPKGTVTLRLDSNQPIDEAMLGDSQGEPVDPAGGPNHRIAMKCSSQGEPLFLTMTVRTGEANEPFSLSSTYGIGDEKTDHALEAGQLLLPWAPLDTGTTTQPLVLVPDLGGGDPDRGRALFTGDQARCSQCHLFRGQGGQVGPDLTEIERKGRAEIYRSIAAPSAAIEPAYATYTIVTKTGQVVAGIARAEGGNAIRVTDTNAHATLIPRSEIEQIRQSATSIMPVGLTATLGDGAIRDIIAFLTSRASRPASR
jgi:putative heme-binding domain-containing protein